MRAPFGALKAMGPGGAGGIFSIGVGVSPLMRRRRSIRGYLLIRDSSSPIHGARRTITGGSAATVSSSSSKSRGAGRPRARVRIRIAIRSKAMRKSRQAIKRAISCEIFILGER